MILNRRDFLKLAISSSATVLAVSNCGRAPSEDTHRLFPEVAAASLYYDTYIMALYMDGTLGPKTGIVTVDMLTKRAEVKMKFWHGHGGVDHFFTISPTDFDDIKALKKVTLTTTPVQNHSHRLFIDMSDAKWRVPGAKGVRI